MQLQAIRTTPIGTMLTENFGQPIDDLFGNLIRLWVAVSELWRAV